jgi:DUF4097 and DUF4098 domain-containing protein YvlB
MSARLALSLVALAAVAIPAVARDTENSKYKAEFHQTYPLAANGRVELENVNGAVHITAWDQNQVKVDAIKYAGSQKRLDEMQIQVNSNATSIAIKTEYPDHNLSFNHSWDDPGGVEYTLMVPRNARLDEIETVNGSLDITGVGGEVRAETVNGRLVAHGLSGRTKLETVNGHLEAQFNQLSSSSIDLSSVNGGLRVELPSNANAEIEADTVHGGIDNDFGMPVSSHWFSHSLHAQLGSGGARIKLENVNGHIQIQHANDNQAVNSIQDLNHDGNHDDSASKDDDDDDDDSI